MTIDEALQAAEDWKGECPYKVSETLAAEVRRLRDINERFKVIYKVFENQAATIMRYRELLQDALPHIECKTASQDALITAIGNALRGGEE